MGMTSFQAIPSCSIAFSFKEEWEWQGEKWKSQFVKFVKQLSHDILFFIFHRIRDQFSGDGIFMIKASVPQKSYDIAVIGGGIAGVAAALQAARCGMHTVLVEKYAQLGGLATAGLVNVYLPLCDGYGTQVTFGLAEELLKASLKFGPGEIPECWNKKTPAGNDQRFLCTFSPAALILAMDELLENAGVDVWYDTVLCNAETENGLIRRIHCYNTSGLCQITAKEFIDSTGDCSLARLTQIPCHDENNYLSCWALLHKEGAQYALGKDMTMFVNTVPWDPEKAPPETIYRHPGGKETSRFIMESRKMLRTYLLNQYANPTTNFDRNTLFPLNVASMPQFRKIYSIDAQYILDSGENQRHFDDSIALVPDWRKAGPVWEIPYRCLLPAGNCCRNFLAAGRNIGARNDAWEVTRVIPAAAITGQAAGMAAALAIRNGWETATLPSSVLQQELCSSNVAVHLEEVGLSPVSGEGE